MGRAGSLCDIVSFIAHSAWTGELLVFDEGSSRSLYFEQGFVVGAQSTAASDRLGEVLWRYGILDRDQIFACSEATGSGAARFGEAAVKLGFVTREKLEPHGQANGRGFLPHHSCRAGDILFLRIVRRDPSIVAPAAIGHHAGARGDPPNARDALFRRESRPMRTFPSKLPGAGPSMNRPRPSSRRSTGRAQWPILAATSVRGSSKFHAPFFNSFNRDTSPSTRRAHRSPTWCRSAIKRWHWSCVSSTRSMKAIRCASARGLCAEGEDLRHSVRGRRSRGRRYARREARRANAKALPAAIKKDETLSKLFHEYASYALFLARPHLRRAQAREHAMASDLSSKARLS